MKGEKLQSGFKPQRDFDEMFELALNFLSSPWILWTSDNPEHRKTLMRLVFAAPLPYRRNQGFRTTKTTSPFKALAMISDNEKKMAESEGVISHEIFDTLADIEYQLKHSDVDLSILFEEDSE